MTNNFAVSKKIGSLRYLGLWLFLGAALLCAYFHVISGLLHAWAGSDDNSHGFVIIPLALYFVWHKRQAL